MAILICCANFRVFRAFCGLCCARVGAGRHGSGVLRMHVHANIRFVKALGLYLFGGWGVGFTDAYKGQYLAFIGIRKPCVRSTPCVQSITIRLPQTSDPRPYQAIRVHSCHSW
ncbi:MAG: hypothetical protein LAT54_10010 [Cryomorphaceae bacterium]|nr:hypothetical protein [Cryomorphaceae bacterium]